MNTLAIFKIEDIANDALRTAASIALLVLGVLYLALMARWEGQFTSDDAEALVADA